MILQIKVLKKMLKKILNKIFKMKEIVIDTETTGLSVKDGHRIVEIGCIELDELNTNTKKISLLFKS